MIWVQKKEVPAKAYVLTFSRKTRAAGPREVILETNTDLFFWTLGQSYTIRCDTKSDHNINDPVAKELNQIMLIRKVRPHRVAQIVTVAHYFAIGAGASDSN